MRNFYDQLGAELVVNARGRATVLGNCILRPEVFAVMSEAAR
jgi:hypothetical protein